MLLSYIMPKRLSSAKMASGEPSARSASNALNRSGDWAYLFTTRFAALSRARSVRPDLLIKSRRPMDAGSLYTSPAWLTREKRRGPQTSRSRPRGCHDASGTGRSGGPRGSRIGERVGQLGAQQFDRPGVQATGPGLRQPQRPAGRLQVFVGEVVELEQPAFLVGQLVKGGTHAGTQAAGVQARVGRRQALVGHASGCFQRGDVHRGDAGQDLGDAGQLGGRPRGR